MERGISILTKKEQHQKMEEENEITTNFILRKRNKRNYFCEEPCLCSQYQFLLFGESLSQVDHLSFQLH